MAQLYSILYTTSKELQLIDLNTPVSFFKSEVGRIGQSEEHAFACNDCNE